MEWAKLGADSRPGDKLGALMSIIDRFVFCAYSMLIVHSIEHGVYVHTTVCSTSDTVFQYCFARAFYGNSALHLLPDSY